MNAYKDEAPTAATVQGFRDKQNDRPADSALGFADSQAHAMSHQSATAVTLRKALDEKRVANAIALAALAGIELRLIDGDDGPELIATRWALTKRFGGGDHDALDAWLARVDGRKLP